MVSRFTAAPPALLGPLDISPVDLSRVEIIKGAASSLYGGQALGGVINLISKPPTGRNEVLLNRRTIGVTDAATWLSRCFSENSGLSLLMSGTIPSAADPDDDGWSDQPRARRWGVRPRFSFSDTTGRSLFVHGRLWLRRSPGRNARSRARAGRASVSRGIDGTARGRGHDAAPAAIRLRTCCCQTCAFDQRKGTTLRAQPDRARSCVSTGFADSRYIEVRARRAGLRCCCAGRRLSQQDQLDVRSRLGYTGTLHDCRSRHRIVHGVGERARDYHPETRLELTERLAITAHPNDDWSVRVSGGTGFAAPTSMTERLKRSDFAAFNRVRSARSEAAV